ncbi:HAD family hydrolase [Chryseobacterium indologenes]|uniref:HAD family hydrolase n=1 Tax=Chryseobacterium indologenes TaxID=253 RepID=UPI0009A18C4E|nr:HAD family hydrolase [Chryseobacterium indologenes]
MNINRESIKIIAFDADDTLWINEPYYQKAEVEFCQLLENYLPQHSISKELFETEMNNLSLYGYGVKGFILCMIETASRISAGQLSLKTVNKIIEIGQDLLRMPIELLDGVEETLAQLNKNYKLIVATKGDLLDQERKLNNSGLQKYFHHVEIMSNKKNNDYLKLMSKLECEAGDFLMIGNSINSDILPVLEVGAQAIHVPYHVTWEHEKNDEKVKPNNFLQIESLAQLLPILL